MKNLLLTSLLALVSFNSYALVSGDRIDCYDNVSRENFSIKIMDIGDEDAYVKVKGENARFYPAELVVFDESKDFILVAMLDQKSKKIIESIEVPTTIEQVGSALGTYVDMGDSRPVKCMLR